MASACGICGVDKRNHSRITTHAWTASTSNQNSQTKKIPVNDGIHGPLLPAANSASSLLGGLGGGPAGALLGGVFGGPMGLTGTSFDWESMMQWAVVAVIIIIIILIFVIGARIVKMVRGE